MPISDFPSELIIITGTYLEGHDLYHLILVSRRFSALLLPLLRRLALRPEHARAALYWAVLSGDRALAEYVLEKGETNMEATAKRGESCALVGSSCHYAPTEGVSRDINEDVLDFAMRQQARLHIGCSPEYREFQSEYKATKWAIKNGHYALLKLALLKRNTWSAKCCSTILFFAAIREKNTNKCQEELMKIILEQASHSLGEQEYREALGLALVMAMRGAMESTVQFLLHKGADPNTQWPWGKVPVLGYVRRLSLKMASARVAGMLLDYGADVGALEEGEPLIVAFGIGCHSVRIVELLEQNKGKLCLNENPAGWDGKEVDPRGASRNIELTKLAIRISRSMGVS